MAEALADLPQSAHPDLLVGFNRADDAGVFRISDTQALVQTVDFFPPIVDDPYAFGQIAAANALSDVFAMGGQPLTALNIVGFPAGTMPKEILAQILKGGSEKIEEAGAVVVGGHSIKDKELKYGIAVTGLIDPGKIVTNGGARVGDHLFLTKPLGTGVITTGIKRNAVDSATEHLVIEQMAALNKSAAEVMTRHGVHAATDITGYGLLGHAHEIAEASEVALRLSVKSLPFIPEAARLAAAGMNPGGANDNRSYLETCVEIASDIDKSFEQLLYDPQTSGGLLFAIPPDSSRQAADALRALGLPHAIVGEVINGVSGRLIVTPD